MVIKFGLYDTILFYLTFFSLFIYFGGKGEGERERERQTDRQTDRETGEGQRERIPRRLCTVRANPDVGFELTNSEIMTWAKIKSWTFNPLSYPDAPDTNSLKCIEVKHEINFHTWFMCIWILCVVHLNNGHYLLCCSSIVYLFWLYCLFP